LTALPEPGAGVIVTFDAALKAAEREKEAQQQYKLL
jgi:hypothetical protein